MAVLTENKNSFFLSTPAILLDDDKECASDWASKHIIPNKWFKWILANYVEADKPNLNKQYWSLGDLEDNVQSIANTPMNLGHRHRNIVGSWTNAEILYPTESSSNPHIETLGALWKYYFPEVMNNVQDAYDIGSLAVSMECVAESITCFGENGCQQTFDYAGPHHDSYCDHLNSYASVRKLNHPHFLAGALVLPPENPAWPGADVKELSTLTTDEEKDRQIESIKSEFPNLDAAQWEKMMYAIMSLESTSKVKEKRLSPTSIGRRIANSIIIDSYL